METKLIMVTESEVKEIPRNELKTILREVLIEMEDRKENLNREKKERETLFSINQIAHRLGRSHATIRKLVASGILRTTADGMVSEKSINEYLRNT